MSVTTTALAQGTSGWLRGPTFDAAFIAVPLVVGLACGATVASRPAWFHAVFLANLWLLGQHHVVSTFTRLAFDRESLRTHRDIVLWLPIAVVTATLYVAATWGIASLVTLYLYWQWFHYARQSWGVSQAYRRKAGLMGHAPLAEHVAFYLVPAWGILHRSHQAPGSFLGLPVHTLPIPAPLLDATAAAAISGGVLWIAMRLRTAWQRQLPLAHTLYVASHYAIFVVAYIAIDDIDYGWLTINIWHNAQYILFVWLYNNNRFKHGVSPQARILSYLSQTRNAWLYGLVCIALAGATYASLRWSMPSLALLVVSYQVINFHHYIADGLIWKAGPARAQQTSLS